MKLRITSVGSNTAEAAQNGRLAIRLIGEVLDKNHSPHSDHSFIASYKTGSEYRLTVFVEEVAEQEREMVYQIHDELKILGAPLSFVSTFS